MKRITVIDSHTGGEPTRLVTAGFPDLGHGSMAERRQQLAEHHDQWRAACMLEPRGNDVLVGALLCEPVDPINPKTFSLVMEFLSSHGSPYFR